MGTKIVDLPQIVTVQGTDVLPVSQAGAGTRVTYKMSVDQLKNYVGSSISPTGGITSIGFQSHDNSIAFINNPLTTNGNVDFSVNSLSANKIIWSSNVIPLSSVQDINLKFIPKPSSATGGQVLTYNASTATWVASAAPQPVTFGNAKAWVLFDGTVDPPTIRKSFNVSGITKNSTGNYTINFTTPMADINYVLAGNNDVDGSTQASWTWIKSRSTSSVTIIVGFEEGSSGTRVPQDNSYINCVIFN